MGKLIEYQYNQIKNFRTNNIQKETLAKLKTIYKIDISAFIRIAIKEKIERDYCFLKEKISKKDCPFWKI